MATLGDKLAQPEAGWKRYYNTEQGFAYTGTWNENGTDYHSSTNINARVSFAFYGQQLRIIGSMNTVDSTNIQVDIDGVKYSYSDYASSLLTSRLVFEKTNLEMGSHSVSVTNLVGGKYFTFSAIDIDSNGYLIGAANLVASAGNAEVNLSWNAIDGAVGYNVKRSNTKGGPYTTIASGVTDTNYVDTAVTNGVTYYYVVTAITGTGESAKSNEAAATPEGNNLFRITLSDSSEREYQVNTTGVNNFIEWFNRAIGTENSYYSFAKMVGMQSSTEFLAYDKIISFKTITVNNQVILKIIMSDSSEREYKVTSADDFVNWFNRTVANCSTGTNGYSFIDTVDGSNEYLGFDKIISFEVLEIK